MADCTRERVNSLQCLWSDMYSLTAWRPAKTRSQRICAPETSSPRSAPISVAAVLHAASTAAMALVWGIVSSSKSFCTAGILSLVRTTFSGTGKGFEVKQVRESMPLRPSSATKVVGMGLMSSLSRRSSYMSWAPRALRLITPLSAIF